MEEPELPLEPAPEPRIAPSQYLPGGVFALDIGPGAHQAEVLEMLRELGFIK